MRHLDISSIDLAPYKFVYIKTLLLQFFSVALSTVDLTWMLTSSVPVRRITGTEGAAVILKLLSSAIQ